MLNVKYRAKKGLLDAKIGCVGHVLGMDPTVMDTHSPVSDRHQTLANIRCFSY